LLQKYFDKETEEQKFLGIFALLYYDADSCLQHTCYNFVFSLSRIFDQLFFLP